MLRILVSVALVGLLGCSEKPTEPSRVSETTAREALIAGAGQVGQAMLREDHQLMADHTHPALIKGMGGRARFVQRLAEIAAEMKGQGFGFTDFRLSEPSELVESGGAVYTIVPYDLHMTGPGGATGVTPSYLIGVSTDGGRTWKFIDGAGLAGDRAKLLQVLPEFPAQLAIPPAQEPRWKN